MRCVVAVILLAIVLAPSLGDFAARPAASACRVAPCCAGKSASCPMHHPSGGTGMRSCPPSERDATLTVALAILRVEPRLRRMRDSAQREDRESRRDKRQRPRDPRRQEPIDEVGRALAAEQRLRRKRRAEPLK